MLVHSTALRVHQPFDTVMENSRVKTRSSEQTMLSNEAHISLVMDSSSEEDSETDDQSYPPSEVYALTWQGYVAHIVRMVSCIAMSFDWFRHALCECHLFSLFILYVNYETHLIYPGIIYVNFAMSSC